TSPPLTLTLFPYTTLFRSRSPSSSLMLFRVHEAVAVGPAACFCPVRHVQLAVDVREVKLHRLLRNPQPARELPIRVALGGQRQRSEEHTSELQSRSDLVCR